ncbi:hypothetical protein AMTRI_Chr05g60250 [Amborella trichopoda]
MHFLFFHIFEAWNRWDLVVLSIHSLLFYWWFLLFRIFFSGAPIGAVVCCCCILVHHYTRCYSLSLIKLLTLCFVRYFGIWALPIYSMFILFALRFVFV